MNVQCTFNTMYSVQCTLLWINTKSCITPLLKNENDSEIPANYRPISQLPFTKILEHTVSNQISTFF